MKLSKNFDLADFTRSEVARKKGISNIPSDEHAENLIALCENVLEPIVENLKIQFTITSGYRSSELNKEIGGSANSQHSRGQAVDIDSPKKNKEIFDYIKDNLKFDQLIWEFGNDLHPDWIHVSYSKEKNRGQVLRVRKVKGKTQYSVLE